MGWLIALGLVVWWLNGYGAIELAKGPGRPFPHAEQVVWAWIAPIVLAKKAAELLWERLTKK